MLCCASLVPMCAAAQMSLEEYRRAVVEYSHQVRVASAASVGAHAELRYRRREAYPSLSAGGDVALAFDDVGAAGRWSSQLRADVEQPIFAGGGIRASVRGAAAEYEAAQHRESSAYLAVRYDAEVAYWRLSRMAIYMSAMCDYRDIVRALYDVVSWRFSDGYTSRSDLLQVESRLSDAEYMVSQATQQWRVALHNFNVLRGADPDVEVVLSCSITDSLAMPMRRSLSGVVDTHPDYLASVALREAARWGVKIRNADFMPSIGVGLYGLYRPSMNSSPQGASRLGGGVALTLRTPIFHFGQRSAALTSARAQLRRAELDVESVTDNIVRDESNGWTNLVLTHQRVEAVRRSLAVARENLDISTYAYQEGLATILDVLQAQISWLQIYQNSIAAHYDHAVAISSYKYIISE